MSESSHIPLPRDLLFGRIVLYTVSLWVLYSFLLSLILPTITFSYNIRNTDPLYDMSDPVGGQIPSSDLPHTLITASSERGGSTAHLTVQSQSHLDGVSVRLYKTHSAWLTPEVIDHNTASSSLLPLAGHKLVTLSNGYALVDDQTLRPIDRPETLLALGLSFDSAYTSSSAERAAYDTGKIFTIRDTHPSGTIFAVTDTPPSFYSFTGEGIVKIDTPADGTHSIPVSSSERDDFLSCTLHKNLLRQSYSCTFDITDFSDHYGKDYIFALPEIEPTMITAARMQLTQSPTTANIFAQLGIIKQKLAPQ